MTDDNYWTQFWIEHGKENRNSDEQTQVLRTYQKKPIDNDLWEFTLNKIDEHFLVEKGDKVLDLCSGNGLFSKHFVSKGCKSTAVDISEDLLLNVKDDSSITPIVSDIRELNFNNNYFDKVFFYAGIQYLTHKETIKVLANIFKWLKKGGVLYIGDIPDSRKIWTFYNTKERQKVYFKNLESGKAIVGTWFDPDFLKNLIKYIGFQHEEMIEQDPKMIYSKFRFDFKCKK
ncbi:MAG: class I SAM-dependent methyltransferase [Candidatus Paceibacterota bacterium]